MLTSIFARALLPAVCFRSAMHPVAYPGMDGVCQPNNGRTEDGDADSAKAGAVPKYSAYTHPTEFKRFRDKCLAKCRASSLVAEKFRGSTADRREAFQLFMQARREFG